MEALIISFITVAIILVVVALILVWSLFWARTYIPAWIAAPLSLLPSGVLLAVIIYLISIGTVR